MGPKNSTLNAKKLREGARQKKSVSTGPPEKQEGAPKSGGVGHGRRLLEQQFGVLKQAASLVYRARNGVRALNEAIRAGSASVSNSEIKQLREHHAQIKELLFEEVAILPSGIFRILHGQGHTLQNYCFQVEDVLRQKWKRPSTVDSLKSLEEGFLLVDEGYHQLTEAIRTELGVFGG